MKESIGYTVTLNIMIVFITVIVVFLSSALIYFKSNKASNVITSAIEEYEGYNAHSKNEISMHLTSLGYGSKAIDCSADINDKGAYNGKCSLINDSTLEGYGTKGYCVYICYEEDNFDKHQNYKGEYYYYKIRTNMMINIPIINDLMDIPIYSNTDRLYNFDK